MWAMLALIPATNAGWSFGWQLFMLPTGLVLLTGWIICSFRKQAQRYSRPSKLLWFAIPIITLLPLALSTTNYGLAFRLWLCEDEIREFAESARSGNESISPVSAGRAVGLFHICWTTANGSEMTLITTRGLYENCGISYWPEGLPNGSGDEYQHLFGPWYRFYSD